MNQRHTVQDRRSVFSGVLAGLTVLKLLAARMELQLGVRDRCMEFKLSWSALRR